MSGTKDTKGTKGSKSTKGNKGAKPQEQKPANRRNQFIFGAIVIGVLAFIVFGISKPQDEALDYVYMAEAQAALEEIYNSYADADGKICFAVEVEILGDDTSHFCINSVNNIHWNAIQSDMTQAGSALTVDAVMIEAYLPVPVEGLTPTDPNFDFYIRTWFDKEVIGHLRIAVWGCPGHVSDSDCGTIQDIGAATYLSVEQQEVIDTQYRFHPFFGGTETSAGIFTTDLRWHGNCYAIAAILLEATSPARDWEIDAQGVWNGFGCPFALPTWDYPHACEFLAAHWSRTGSFLPCPPSEW